MTPPRSLLAPITAALCFAAAPASAANYNWTAGLFQPGVTAPSPLPAADTLTISSAQTKQFNNVSFTNDGTVLWLANGGSVGLASNARVVNNGLWEDQGTGALSTFNAAGGTFDNNGVYRKTGAGLSVLVPLVLTNAGLIDVQQGTLRLQNSSTSVGTVTGDGAYEVGGAGLTNAGILAPGSFGIGTLGLTGNYLQSATGSFVVDLNGAASADRFNIIGGASLAGALAIHCLACSMAVGDSVTILDATSALSGSFASLSLVGFASGAFDIIYDQTDKQVRLLATEAVTAAVPEPGSWALMLGGLGLLGWAARRRVN